MFVYSAIQLRAASVVNKFLYSFVLFCLTNRPSNITMLFYSRNCTVQLKVSSKIAATKKLLYASIF